MNYLFFFHVAPNPMEMKLIPRQMKEIEFINDFVVQKRSVVKKMLQRQRAM